MDHIAAPGDRFIPSGIGAKVSFEQADSVTVGRHVKANLVPDLVAMPHVTNAAANVVVPGQQLPGDMPAEKTADSGHQNSDVATF